MPPVLPSRGHKKTLQHLAKILPAYLKTQQKKLILLLLLFTYTMCYGIVHVYINSCDISNSGLPTQLIHVCNMCICIQHFFIYFLFLVSYRSISRMLYFKHMISSLPCKGIYSSFFPTKKQSVYAFQTYPVYYTVHTCT